VVFGIFRRRRRNKLRAVATPPTWDAILGKNAPFVRRLADAHRAKLIGDIKVLVAEKTFIGAGGLEVTEEHRVTIAAAAARLVIHLDVDRYDNLTEIVVYPGAYQHAGSDGETAVLGEAHSWGVVVLAWDAVVGGMRDLKDGHDTAVHEFAHVLDRVDGAFDGAPELHAHDHYRPWATAMQRNFDRLRGKDKGLRKVMRDYGATNEAEFFAVATESFFEKPDGLKARAPDLYEALVRFYGGDPLTPPR
jgi:Mlc titration factor MtfA (ptsG expression regulator)